MVCVTVMEGFTFLRFEKSGEQSVVAQKKGLGSSVCKLFPLTYLEASPAQILHVTFCALTVKVAHATSKRRMKRADEFIIGWLIETVVR